MLICSELEIRSDIIAQLVFYKQVIPPDVLTRVTIGKYVAGLLTNSDCTNFAQNLQTSLLKALTRLNYSAILPFYHFMFKSSLTLVDYNCMFVKKRQ